MRLSITTSRQVGKLVKSARRAYLRFNFRQDCPVKMYLEGRLICFRSVAAKKTSEVSFSVLFDDAED